MDRQAVASLDKETLIRLVLSQAEAIAVLTSQVALLTARVAELDLLDRLAGAVVDQVAGLGDDVEGDRRREHGGGREVHGPAVGDEGRAAGCHETLVDACYSKANERESFRARFHFLLGFSFPPNEM